LIEDSIVGAIGRVLTVGEASYVVERTAAAINRAVDRGLIEAAREPRDAGGEGGTVLRKLGPAELRYLLVEGDLEGDLTPSGRRRAYDAIRALPDGEHRVQVGPGLALELADVDERIAARLARLDAAKAHMEEGGAEPVLRGTDGVPVYLVAALAAGQGVDATLEDHPGLTRAQVEAAAEYARAYPKSGRPYPARSFTRMLGELADLGAFDPAEAEDGEDARPAP
jgi:uncharacterized protein (DUF433 family)